MTGSKMINSPILASAILTACLFLSGCFKSPEQGEKEIVNQLAEITYRNIDAQRQGIFNAIHPMGTTSGVSINDFRVSQWRDGDRTGKWKDVATVDYTYTIYWNSTLVPNGYTRIYNRFDFRVGKTVLCRVTETNGFTKRDVSDMTDFLGALLTFE